MKLRYLLAAAAIPAMALAVPATAQVTSETGTCGIWCPPPPPPPPENGDDPSVSVEYSNSIDTSLRTSVDYEKEVHLYGGALLLGLIGVDSSAVAVNDPKQILDGNDVTHTSDNAVQGFSVSADGNTGVNLAAGTLNQQMNSAVIAISDDADPYYGGWSEASTTSLQHLDGNTYSPGYGFGNNAVAGGAISGAGNIGVNAVAGAFNQQSNLMTLAVASNSTLAEASAGLVQLASGNDIDNCNCHSNTVGSLTIANATGNIGVNMAAGTGNQQLNSLTIASSSSDN